PLTAIPSQFRLATTRFVSVETLAFSLIMSTEEDKPMEFWGLELKVGQTVKVEPKEGKVLHLSQACLGEHKKEKGTDQVLLYANKDGQKFVLANLSGEKFPHVSFDLVFEDEFELSHTWKHGSVHLAGYLTIVPNEDLYPFELCLTVSLVLPCFSPTQF
ncbi:Histone deacetylase HDT1-like protein, partial [Drosera capensis]